MTGRLRTKTAPPAPYQGGKPRFAHPRAAPKTAGGPLGYAG